MNEDEARAWIEGKFGDAAAKTLDRFVQNVEREAAIQNLLSKSTLPQIWSRHVLDSAQLADLDDGRDGPWLDIGAGGGFPGMVVALLLQRPMILCEPRPLRANFLKHVIGELGLGDRVSVAMCRVQELSMLAHTISARAVAPVGKLIVAARHCSLRDTHWLLPRGRSIDAALNEVPDAATFHVKPSISDPTAGILMMRGITP